MCQFFLGKLHDTCTCTCIYDWSNTSGTNFTRISIPPQIKVCGIYRNHFIRLLVCLLSVCRSACTIMLSPYLSYKRWLWYEGVSGFWPKIIKATLMLVEGKVHNSCPVYLFLLKIHWMSLLHKKIPYDLRMSWFWQKDIWAGSRSLEEKVHSSYLVIFLFWETLKFPISHKNAYNIECVRIFTQRHLDRFKVNGR